MKNTITYPNHILLIQSFWDTETCAKYIQTSVKLGYEAALVQTEFGQRRVDHIRNNQRVIHLNHEWATQIWTSLTPYFNQVWGHSEAIGLNELFRFYKYKKGQTFKKHRDLPYIRNNEESSYFTLLIYLNDDFEGGETTFDDLSIQPKAGEALIFPHELLHSGAPVVLGTKYVLRTDIMFKLKPEQ